MPPPQGRPCDPKRSSLALPVLSIHSPEVQRTPTPATGAPTSGPVTPIEGNLPPGAAECAPLLGSLREEPARASRAVHARRQQRGPRAGSAPPHDRLPPLEPIDSRQPPPSPTETVTSCASGALGARFLAPDPVPAHSRLHGAALRQALQELTRDPQRTHRSIASTPRRSLACDSLTLDGQMVEWNRPELHRRRDARIGSSPYGSMSKMPFRRRMTEFKVPALPLLMGHRYNVEHLGIRLRGRFGDFYHNLLDVSWWKLLLGLLVVWIVLLLFFTVCLKFTCASGIAQVVHLDADAGPADVCTFRDLFWFNTHTLSTTGYGRLYPVGPGQFFAMAEMWVSVVYSCVAAAIAFHKMARPSKLRESIVFSEKVVVNHETLYYRYLHRDHVDKEPCLYCVERGEYRSGEPCLMFRLAHTHRRQHVQANFHLYLYQEFPGHAEDAPTLDAPTDDHAQMLKHLEPINYSFTELNFYCTLQYGRARGMNFSAPMPCLPFLIVHHLDESSPLRGATRESLQASRAEIVAVYDAVDEGCGDVVQSRHAYRAEDVLWDRRFVDMVFRDQNTGRLVVDFTRLDLTVNCLPLRKDATVSTRSQTPKSPCSPRASPHTGAGVFPDPDVPFAFPTKRQSSAATLPAESLQSPVRDAV
eukprot:TRINITY_DN65614_c0_g1_i1.p1 TRINITY_DN65614_c0_g1~~TRINITY_DN65614_c0_g1_i1.p1  ORF type:complete len:670 (+),score=118.60 TRINITY_DN65614_c0_g1_i1:79-2010(+)